MRALIIFALCCGVIFVLADLDELADLFAALALTKEDSPLSPVSVVEARLKTEEGFRAMPYRDSEGVLTIGYGTNLEIGITEREGAYLLSERVHLAEIRFSHEWKPYQDMPADVRVELIDMAYQLGVTGLLGFHDMLKNLALGNYEGAALEAERSAWATETPLRAARAAEVFRSHK